MIKRLAVVLGLMALACDRKKESVVATPPPAATTSRTVAQAMAEHSAESPAVTPLRPATRPICIITVSDQPVIFPPAKLVLQQNAGGITATLFSDDPPEAVKDDYRGNSFRFEAALEGDSIDDAAGQTFTWKASAEDKRDPTSGIFLAGQHQMVLPSAATLTLMKVGQQWTANLAGEFTFIDNQKENAEPLIVHANADLTAELVTTSGRR